LITVRYVSEAVSAELISHQLAFDAVRPAMIAAADAANSLFPTVIGHAAGEGERFSIKSATTAGLTGLKVGSYWPRNPEQGRRAHSSMIFLFDPACGLIDTIVAAGLANAYRTAAADALAVDVLARPDAGVLAVFGAGHQALFECAAIARVRKLREIWIVNRDAAKAEVMAGELEQLGLSARIAATAAEACARADIIVTATASRAPLFAASSVRPGAHISCMGADARGKQEVPVEVLRQAQLYCDYLDQALAIGELQHVAHDVTSGRLTAHNLGDVLAGRAPGRRDPNAVTVFDSSGIALQDLYLAERLLKAAEDRRLVQHWPEGGQSAAEAQDVRG
jgi:ornithine cyclodeaminase